MAKGCAGWLVKLVSSYTLLVKRPPILKGPIVIAIQHLRKTIFASHKSTMKDKIFDHHARSPANSSAIARALVGW